MILHDDNVDSQDDLINKDNFKKELIALLNSYNIIYEENKEKCKKNNSHNQKELNNILSLKCIQFIIQVLINKLNENTLKAFRTIDMQYFNKITDIYVEFVNTNGNLKKKISSAEILSNHELCTLLIYFENRIKRFNLKSHKFKEGDLEQDIARNHELNSKLYKNEKIKHGLTNLLVLNENIIKKYKDRKNYFETEKKNIKNSSFAIHYHNKKIDDINKYFLSLKCSEYLIMNLIKEFEIEDEQFFNNSNEKFDCICFLNKHISNFIENKNINISKNDLISNFPFKNFLESIENYIEDCNFDKHFYINDDIIRKEILENSDLIQKEIKVKKIKFKYEKLADIIINEYSTKEKDNIENHLMELLLTNNCIMNELKLRIHEKQNELVKLQKKYSLQFNRKHRMQKIKQIKNGISMDDYKLQSNDLKSSISNLNKKLVSLEYSEDIIKKLIYDLQSMNLNEYKKTFNIKTNSKNIDVYLKKCRKKNINISKNDLMSNFPFKNFLESIEDYIKHCDCKSINDYFVISNYYEKNKFLKNKDSFQPEYLKTLLWNKKFIDFLKEILIYSTNAYEEINQSILEHKLNAFDVLVLKNKASILLHEIYCINILIKEVRKNILSNLKSDEVEEIISSLKKEIITNYTKKSNRIINDEEILETLNSNFVFNDLLKHIENYLINHLDYEDNNFIKLHVNKNYHNMECMKGKNLELKIEDNENNNTTNNEDITLNTTAITDTLGMILNV